VVLKLTKPKTTKGKGRTMVKMLEGEFPGAIAKQNNSFSAIVNPKDIAVTTVSGPPGCGKTTLRNILATASICIGGHITGDSSETIDWHLDRKNKSPFYEEAISAQKERSLGILVPDETIFKFISYWLKVNGVKVITEKMVNQLTHFDLSGFPRNHKQAKMLEDKFKSIRFFSIVGLDEIQANENRLARIANGTARADDREDRFKKRWLDYHKYSEPYILQGIADGSIIPINYNCHLKKKVLKIAHYADYSDSERLSIKSKIINDAFDAFWLIQKIEDPDAYRIHMQKQLKLKQQSEHAPQFHMAKAYFSQLTATATAS
jgi:adenylate kinase family enzyme